MHDIFDIIELNNRRKELGRMLGEMIFGAIEIREKGDKKYVYLHSRVNGRQVSSYIGEYTEELYNLIASNNKKARAIKKEIREIVHRLNELGYSEQDIPENVLRNIDFAKRNLALTIHSQAILEGVATTFAETEEIIENGRASGMDTTDIAKIVNMKRAWEFILDKDVILSGQNLGLLMQINKLIEEGFYYNAGKIRDVPVNIGGTTWRPEMPIPSKITESLENILESKRANIDKAIELVLYVMKSQIFLDGNKRTAIIFANHFLISKGLGLIYVPAEKTDTFKKMLVDFYVSSKKQEIVEFMKKYCYIAI